ncbi:DoxX family protein [Mucilaginibacter sp.]|uniref:DoxX family protein n=1 Tax=Mucilaginibacter sp. TaxID=1882438 RepID=UPI003D0E632D
MKPKTIKIIYWCVTILFALAMFGDAYGGITEQQAGVDVLNHLGYPIYNMPMFGVAKLLGAIALLQSRFRIIKEWAYAGFTFNFISAFVSRAIVGDGISLLIPPLIMLAIMFVSYFFWKKSQALAVAS